jgi:hypothetical protein
LTVQREGEPRYVGSRPTLTPSAPQITRVDRPLPGLWALSLAWPAAAAPSSGSVRDGFRTGCLLLAASTASPGVRLAWVPERPRGESADGAVRGAREKLEGNRLVGLRRSPDGSEVTLEIRLHTEAKGDRRATVVFSTSGLSVGPLLAAPAELPDETLALASWGVPTSETAPFVEAHAHALARAAALEAQRTLTRTRHRLERRLLALQGDTEGMAKADAAAERARLFVAAAHKARTGTLVLFATDWSTGEERTVEFPLRGDRPPALEVEAVFARAKRLRGGLAIIEKRRAETEWALLLIEEAAEELAALTPSVDAPALTAEPGPNDAASAARAPAAFATQITARLRRLTEALPGDIRLDRPSRRQRGGAREGERGRARAGAPARVPYRSFRSSLGTPLLVGKGGADNDALTLHTARPHDVFFHVKDSVGAHVIAVRPSKRTPLDPRVHIDAALLAAHFSSQRGEAVVDVQWCERRHLRKRKGAPPGLVELTQERVLPVRLEPDHVAELLATENRDE